MKQSAFIVKKKFFTLVLFLLMAFVLTIASCTYNGDSDGKGKGASGSNPGTSGEDHGGSAPIKTLEQLLDEAYNGVVDAAKLTKAKLPYINPETQSSEEIEKHLRPLGLARMEDTPDSKMILFYRVVHYSDPALKNGHKKTYL